MGVEINPNLCAAANENFELNGIKNAAVVVCDSSKFATQILKTKKYTLYEKVVTNGSGGSGNSVVEENSDITTAAATTYTTTVADNTIQETAALPCSTTSATTITPTTPPCNTTSATTTIPPCSTTSATTTTTTTTTTSTTPTAPPCNTTSLSTRAARGANKRIKIPYTPKPSITRIPLYTYNFGAVLVDPPRCGLDTLTLSLIASYDHIIYISCCPESLMRDLSSLLLTHNLVRIALFDQFAYTPHIETGVWLRIK